MGQVPSIAIETITPAQAREWLQNDKTKNRQLSRQVVRAYARDMKAGDWKLTMEPIVFNGTGLLNGQHRLAACVEADTPFQSAVARHVPATARDVMDSGYKRSFGNVLDMRGVSNATACAAICGTLWRIKNQDPMHGRISVSQMMPIFERNQRKIVPAASLLATPPRVPVMGYGIFGALLVCSPEKAEKFVEVFRTGVPAFKGDPAHALREQLMHLKQRKTSPHLKSQLWTAIAIFNAFCDRVPMTEKIKWQTEPTPIEGFNHGRI